MKVNLRTKKNIKEKIKANKGITLIALVITIIVLLILAGITIATLAGNNGILTQAGKAKEETQVASEDELRKLTMLEAATNLENTIYTDKNDKTVTIPAGFAVSQVEGENIIEDGLVIIDTTGNEFVWIPVDNYSDFVRKEGYGKGSQQSYLPNCGEADSTGINSNVTETITTQIEAQEMYTSVEKNGGFYIGRYETGKKDNGKLVIKKGADVYNNIPWSANGKMQETSETTGGAVEFARNFDIANGYKNVKTTLMYGVQWDAIMNLIQDIENTNAMGNFKKYIQDSTGMGWYGDNNSSGNSMHKTGINLEGEKNKVNNIYDLSGNVWEWTMESNSKSQRIRRGGGYNDTGLDCPVSFRSGDFPSSKFDSFGFRISLYL